MSRLEKRLRRRVNTLLDELAGADALERARIAHELREATERAYIDAIGRACLNHSQRHVARSLGVDQRTVIYWVLKAQPPRAKP